MLALTALVSALTAGAILVDWRKALPLVFVVGILQDVFRKLMPSAPAAYILWVAAIFVVVVLAAYANGALKTLRPLYLKSSVLKRAWTLLIVLVFAQAVQTIVRWGNPAGAILGLVFYFGPLVGLLIGFAYARSESLIVRLLVAYVLVMAPAALTVYLSVEYGDQWPVLQDVGARFGSQVLISGYSKMLESHPGVFRVGELAAWHAATCISFMSILAIRKPRLLFLVASSLLAVALIGAIVLTGRRKMLMALAIFFSFQWVLPLVLRRGFDRRSIALLTILCTGTLGFSLFGYNDDNETNAYYLDRTTNVISDTSGRIDTTVELMKSAWYRSGIVGLGAGVAGQGARYAGGDRLGGGSTEVGVGLILVELGLPGLIVFVFLGITLVRRIWYALSVSAKVSPSSLTLAVGFTSLLIANAATFGAATQLYSDLVVLITLGLIGGLLFAVLNRGLVEQARRKELTLIGLLKANMS